MNQYQGKSYLKVTGIIFIILGVILCFVDIMGIAGGSLLLYGGYEADSAVAAVTGGIVVVILVVALIEAVLYLIAGIMGVKHCANPAKAAACFKMGVVLIIIEVISAILSIYSSGISTQAIIQLIVGIILPALYCYGAKLNQK